jgi:hypothetical protein
MSDINDANKQKVEVPSEKDVLKRPRDVDDPSDSSRDGHERQKLRKHHGKRKHLDSSSSRDSSASEEEERRKKKRKKKEKKKRKKKKKKRRHQDDDSAGSDEEGVRRSVITGRKIKMHIEKSEDDLAHDKARKELLRFMNSSFS